MDIDSLYLVVAKKQLENCVRTERKAEWKQLRSKNCTDSFTADAVGNGKFIRESVVTSKKKHDKREPGFSKEELGCSE